MEQPSLDVFVTAAYLVASTLIAALFLASILRARRAKRTLADLERDEA